MRGAALALPWEQTRKSEPVWERFPVTPPLLLRSQDPAEESGRPPEQGPPRGGAPRSAGGEGEGEERRGLPAAGGGETSPSGSFSFSLSTFRSLSAFSAHPLLYFLISDIECTSLHPAHGHPGTRRRLAGTIFLFPFCFPHPFSVAVSWIFNLEIFSLKSHT